MAVSDLIDDVGDYAKTELETPVEIIDCATFPTLDSLYKDARKWKRIEDVVVVTGDLAKSTKLNVDRHTNTSCRIYEAAAGGAARILGDGVFDPEFIDVQGDGLFALYHGERSFERAFCAAVTLRTWSERELVPRIEKISERIPEVGFKVGMAAGTLAVKRVGVPRGDDAPVWAGKPVNSAFKCAQKADRHQIIVTEKVYNSVKDNDYVRYSCGCGGVTSDLWRRTQVTTIGDGQDAWILESPWCVEHGDEFCQAILDGKRKRKIGWRLS